MEQKIEERLQKEAAKEYATTSLSGGASITSFTEELEEAFAAGARWQRNHVWHDISEKPAEPKATTMVDYKYWCYLEDIIPTDR